MEPCERSSTERAALGRYAAKLSSRLLWFLLIEAAQSAIKQDDELRRFYYRLVGRRGPQKALVAVARVAAP